MSRDFLLECEDGDHVDYICPVFAEYTGDIEEVTTRDESGREVHVGDRETHALIYTDGCIAVTVYEHCYAMWSLKSGCLSAGSLWKKGEWSLSEASLKDIKKRAPETTRITRDIIRARGGPPRSFAPWSLDQVASLNAYQAAGYVHPFTSLDGRDLIATEKGWSLDGDPTKIVQDWAHVFMTNWNWKNLAFDDQPLQKSKKT
jgi:hypothetical protein